MPSKRRTLRKAAILGTTALAQMTTFQQFAVAVTVENFNEQNWLNFIAGVRDHERTRPQTLIQTSAHSDGWWHSNSGWHSNSAGTHTNTPHHMNSHLNWGSHTRNPSAHYNIPGAHVDMHEDAGTHTDNNRMTQRHHNRHVNTTNHHNGVAHHDQYNQVNAHNDTVSHSDSSVPHSDFPSHNNSFPHSNSVIPHNNYVPSRPALFSIGDNTEITGTTVLALFSYDRNTDGFGSQDTISRVVHYDLAIRRIQDLNGTANVSAWRTLLDNIQERTEGGARFNLNTIDPLGTGNTNPQNANGIYEIRAIARNLPVNNTAHQSQEQIIRVRIVHNQQPEITVQNGSEFINFTFGFDGALSPANIYRTYQAGLFADAGPDQRNGIFVKVSMLDRDTAAQTMQNWQRGRIYLSRSDNTEIIGTSVPIVWENGQNVISSENASREGIGFIHENAFTTLGDLRNALVTIEVTDFRDAATTIPAGTTVVQRVISGQNATNLTVHVDVASPGVAASVRCANTNIIITNPTEWRNAPFNVELFYTDALSGILTREFVVTNSSVTPTSGWLPYTAPISFNTEGIRFLHFRATDRLRNVRTGVFGPYRLDTTRPVGTVTETIISANQVRLTATASDALSGINRIDATGPLGGSWSSAVSPLTFIATQEGIYTFTVRDNAGNTHTISHNVIFTPLLNNLIMTHIVRPPTGTTAPILFPAVTPINIRAGYRMTFRVGVSRTRDVELRLFSGGQPVTIHTNAGPSQFLRATAPILGSTFVEFAFWVDKNTPRNTVLDMRLTLTRDGHTIINDDVGRRFGVIVGSARESIGINLTR